MTNHASTTTPTAGPACPEHCDADHGGQHTDAVDKLHAGEDVLMPVVALVAALRTRGVDFHLHVDHGPAGEHTPHRHALVIDDAACAKIAELLKAGDFVMAVRKAADNLSALAESLRGKTTDTPRLGLVLCPPSPADDGQEPALAETAAAAGATQAQR